MPFGTLDLYHFLAFAVILCGPGLLRLFRLFGTLGTLGTLTQKVFRVPVLNRVSLNVKVIFATEEAIALRSCDLTCTSDEICLAVGALLATGLLGEGSPKSLPVEIFEEKVCVNEPACVRTAWVTLKSIDLHIYDHRSREVASKKSKASRVELPDFQCPAGNHDSNVKTDCTQIKSPYVETPRALAVLLDVN